MVWYKKIDIYFVKKVFDKISNMNHRNKTILNEFIQFSKIDRKQYQLNGIYWCLERELTPITDKLPVRGGFIFDEMGLGKTIMMIATIVSNLLPRTLIILPNALLDQWKNEFFRTTGHKVYIYHGSSKKGITLDQLNQSVIVLTTYGTVATDILLHQVKWSRLVFDEAHHLRNGTKTARYNKCYQLKAHIRWLITGTPIQNRVRDMSALCKILRLPSEMEPCYIIQNYVLKRTKKEVGLLLKDVEHTEVNVSWTEPKEAEISKQLHACLKARTSGCMLRTMMRARQICCLPTMLTTKMQSMKADGDIVNCYNGQQLGTSKMDVIVKMMISQKGMGKLVFCHFREEMDELMSRLIQHGITDVAIIDGRINGKARQSLLTIKKEVLILQIQTCCEGLNLQEHYNQIYFISPNWNPSIEEQAIARCHRYGQLKTVQVFRFYMEASIEQYIFMMQTRKRQITDDIFG